MHGSDGQPGSGAVGASTEVSTPLIITIDGPAGSGKTTVAWELSRRLGLEMLDTGAMYRGLAAACLEAGLEPAGQPAEVVALAERNPMRFDWSHEPPRLFVGGRDFTHRLRDEDVTQRVSSVAGIGGVRRVLVAQQQQIGREHPRLISEGRDQGSVVFPDARLKFYLEASPAVRARRRTLQRQQAGQPANEQEILQAIIERDRRDETRTDGPLICPSDAVRIDTSPLSLDAVIDRLEWEIRDAVDPMDLAPVRGGG